MSKKQKRKTWRRQVIEFVVGCPETSRCAGILGLRNRESEFELFALVLKLLAQSDDFLLHKQLILA